MSLHVDAASLFSASNLYLDTKQQHDNKVLDALTEQKQPEKRVKKNTEQGSSQHVAATSEASKPKKEKKAKKGINSHGEDVKAAAPAGKAVPQAVQLPEQGTRLEAAAPPAKKQLKEAKQKAKQPQQDVGTEHKQQNLSGRKRKAPAAEQEHVQAPQQQQPDSDSDDEDAGPSNDKQEASKPKRTPEEEAERLTRTLFVGNLPPTMTSKGLKKLFSTFGPIDSVRMRSVPLDPKSKLPRRAAVITGKVDMKRAPAVAYVVCTQKADADKALTLNMSEVDGHHIQVDRASQPAKKAAAGASTDASAGSTEYDPGRSLFCGNLHFQVTNEEIIQFFTSTEALQGNPELEPAAHGGKPAVEAVRVVRDPATSLGKGFAFVMFRTKAAARAALSLNGREIHKRPVRLTRVSVQQQARVRRERESAVASAGKAKQPGGLRRGPAGKPSTRSIDPAQWQGTVTKGKGKGVRGHKDTPGRGAKKPAGGAASAKASGKTGGKRPAVAARKKQMKLQKAKNKPKGGQA